MMQISRSGSSRFLGTTSIAFQTPQFAWDPTGKVLTFKESRVSDFTSNSYHDYTVSLSLDDVQSLLLALSDAAASNPKTLKSGVRSSMKELRRLWRFVELFVIAALDGEEENARMAVRSAIRFVGAAIKARLRDLAARSRKRARKSSET
jgi:signal transduction histidine kinase